MHQNKRHGFSVSFVLAWGQNREGRAERELFVLAQRALRRRRKPPEGAPVSFCFGVAAGSSGSRGARAVRARSALRRRRKPPEGARFRVFLFWRGGRTERVARSAGCSCSRSELCAAGASPRKVHGSVSFCFGAAAGPSGSRGARAVRARAASFAPQAQAPGRCTRVFLFWCGGRIERVARSASCSCAKRFAPQAQAPGRCTRVFLFWCGGRTERVARSASCSCSRSELCAAGASPRKVLRTGKKKWGIDKPKIR